MVISLIEIVSGFVPGFDFNLELQTVLVNDKWRGERCTAQQTAARRQTLQAAHVGIGTLPHARNAGLRHQGIGNVIAPALGASRQQLHYDGIAILIGYHAGQTVGFAMNQPSRIGKPAGEQLGTRARGAANALLEKIRGNGARPPIPDTSGDLRLRAVRGYREHCAISGSHFNGITRLRGAFESCDRAGENPRVTALKRFLPAGLEYEARQSELPLLSELLEESELLLQSPPDELSLEELPPKKLLSLSSPCPPLAIMAITTAATSAMPNATEVPTPASKSPPAAAAPALPPTHTLLAMMTLPVYRRDNEWLSFALRARMRLIVHFSQVLKIELGIDLRGGNTGMSEHFLHRAQITARLQHMRSE